MAARTGGEGWRSKEEGGKETLPSLFSHSLCEHQFNQQASKVDQCFLQEGHKSCIQEREVRRGIGGAEEGEGIKRTVHLTVLLPFPATSAMLSR